jgi:MYXO-CTERM domain-containing protein
VLQIASVELTAATECDDDGNVDAGETAVIAVTLENDGPIGLESTSLSISTGAPSIRFVSGSSVEVGAIGPFEQKTIEVEIAVDVAVAGIDSLSFEVTASDPTSAAPAARLTTTRRINFDDIASSTTRDEVESSVTTWETAGTTELEAPTSWSRDRDQSGNTEWHARDIDAPGDQQLVSPTLEVGDRPFVVRFSHRHHFETSDDTFWDGGVIEISTDDGTNWVDVSELAAEVGYGGTITNESGNPLMDRAAFVGANPSWPESDRTTLDFGTSLAGQSVKLRFRVGTDMAAGDFGWAVDDIAVFGITNLPFSGIGDDADLCGAEPPVTDLPDDEGANSGGCSSTGTGAGAWWLLAAFGLLLVRRRR